ncbi:MAG: hypothetical protein RMM53_12055 [Bacteroidia bacterium]|nr:hypothetical protein [Bacteroidia bacterium]
MKKIMSSAILAMAIFSWVFTQEKDRYDDPRLNTPIPFTLGDRDRLRDLSNEMMHLQKQIDLRFETQDKRLDAMDKRLDAMDKRLDSMQSLLWTIIGLTAALSSGLYFQLIRVNRLLSKHEGILAERRRYEAETDAMQEIQKLKRELEALRSGGVEKPGA